MQPDEIEAFKRELAGLTEDEIRNRKHLWGRGEQALADDYLEEIERARHSRLTVHDRNLQGWILAVAIATLVVSLLGLIYAISR